jgi:hypothetical protein
VEIRGLYEDFREMAEAIDRALSLPPRLRRRRQPRIQTLAASAVRWSLLQDHHAEMSDAERRASWPTSPPTTPGLRSW